MTQAARIAAWTAIADDYSQNVFAPEGIEPTDIAEYPMQIMSLLSDFQERASGAFGTAENDMVNAAKMMLARMIRAARDKERAA
jgi:hypothetical protein